MTQFQRQSQVVETPTRRGDEEDFIDLRRLFDAVWRYKWGILGLAFVVALVTGFAVFSMEPVYRATASIVLESKQANVVNVEDVYSLDTYDYNYNQTQYEILKSRSLAERVVRRLELHRHPVFAQAATEEAAPWYQINLRDLLPVGKKEPPVQLSQEELDEQAIQSVTGAVAAALQVSPVEYSYVVYLGFDSTDAKLAAQVVNALAEGFINSNLENRLQGTLQATDWLSERLGLLKLNLRQSEQALQDFRDREGLVDIEGITSPGGDELKTLSQRLQEATRARIEAQHIKENVQGMRDASIEAVMSLPAVLNHPLVSDLKRDQSAAERKVAELAKRYGPKHPKMISARSDQSASSDALAREVRKVVSGISHEYEVSLRNEQQLKANWEARKSEMQDFNRVEFELQELQRDVDANRQLYDIFFTRIKNVSETGGFEKPHARMIDRAMTPSWPVKPDKRTSIILALVLGTLLGCAVAIVLDILDNTVKYPDEVREKLHTALVGAIPRQKLNTSGDFEQFWENPQSPFAEAIRTIRTGLLLSSLDEPAKIILVTSTVAGEGKSTVALNLGSALGQMERTLVIGSDLRRPSLARKCGLSPNHLGLSHFVSGSAALEDCIEPIQSMGLHVMPAGVIPPNPLEMVSSRRFRDALERLKQEYDRIVIDSAPVQAVSDALVLASYADSVIYVVKADDTAVNLARLGIASLLGSNEPLTGAVLNQFDAKKSRSYYGDAYYQNGNYGQTQTISGA